MTHPIEDKKCCAGCGHFKDNHVYGELYDDTGRVGHCMERNCGCDKYESAPQKDIEGWENEFHKIMSPKWAMSLECFDFEGAYNELKSFIASLLKQERECVAAAIEEMKKTPHDWSKDEHTRTCKDGCTYCSYAEGQTVGWNAVLTELQAKLKNE